MEQTTNVLDTIQGQLGPDTIQKISTQLGTDTAATSSAISMAIPILLGGLSKNAANAEGAVALDNALTAHDGSILDHFGALPGGGDGGGAAILGHILGSLRRPVEEGVERASGLNAQQVTQLLAILAPLVMGVLGRLKRQENVGAEQLPEVLGQANLDMTRKSAAIGDLSRVLDSGNGNITDEIVRIGSTVLGSVLSQNVSS
jgi:hypothetical protein